MFADSADKKGGEFYTPTEVVRLLVALLKPHAGMKVYDPTVGFGGMLIINKQKPEERRGKVLFINSELEYEEGKNQNRLRDEDINKIVTTFEDYEEIKRYSRVVALAEIEENDWNLNIRRYADTSPPPEIFDVRAILYDFKTEIESKESIREVISRHSREGGDGSPWFERRGWIPGQAGNGDGHARARRGGRAVFARE